MEQLKKICDMVIDVEEGLLNGNIEFYYDNLMCAMKPGHPMEILDEILAEIFWDIQADEIPSREHLKNVYENFKAFKATFRVKEMRKPIQALGEYLYPKKNYTFPIYINGSGESFFDYALSENEVKKIKKAIGKNEDFEEATGLKTLYKKVMKAAKDKLIEDIDMDTLEYNVGYPKLN